MKAFIRRAKEVNLVVNAIVAERYTDALEEAKEVDRILSQDSIPEEFSKSNKPFLGVPLSVKEAFALQGQWVFLLGLIPEREILWLFVQRALCCR